MQCLNTWFFFLLVLSHCNGRAGRSGTHHPLSPDHPAPTATRLQWGMKPRGQTTHTTTDTSTVGNEKEKERKKKTCEKY